MSTVSVSSSKIERDLPSELEAARSLNKYLRTYLGHVCSIKKLVMETEEKLNELRIVNTQWIDVVRKQ